MNTDTILRAINYFTIWELVGRSQAKATETWRKLRTLLPMTDPIDTDAYRFVAQADVDASHINQVHRQVAKSFDLLAVGDRVVELGSPEYPGQLADTDDAPEYLFVRGNLQLLYAPALAVVGTRKPTDQGRRRARKLGFLLARRRLVVASGLALGIDEAAHLGALEVGGDTIAVIGTPLHMTYPKEHKELQDQIARVGVVVSQFYPGAGIRQYNFPMRNAVMSGLCRGTVVVEAGETSGALIQARKCLQQGRKLFIPQSAIDNPSISWPKRFIERGGVQFSTIEQVLAEIDEFLPPESVSAGYMGDVAVCSLKLTTSPH